MPARRAEDLCASYLINTKIFYDPSVYGHTDAVISLLKELGARAVRERVTTGTSTGTISQQRAMLELSSSGIRWHGTVAEMSDWQNPVAANREVMSLLSSWYAPRLGGNLAALMRSFGGVNEIDHERNGPDWAKHARSLQTALWSEAKSRPATQNIPVAGPTTRSDLTPYRAAMLGDLSAVSDLGSFNYYNQGTSPTRGISQRISLSRPNYPQAKAWVVAETGYNNSRQTNKNVTVPESASATYVIRGICDFFKRKADYGRFELLDDPDPIDFSSQTTINRTADIQAHFGLVAMTKSTVATATPDTWRKKPEFYSTKRFLALLSDRGAAFQPEGLRMQVSGGSDLQTLLVQKRDRRHYLVLWRDVVVSSPYPSGSTWRVAPVNVTLTLGTARPMAVYEPGHSSSPVAVSSSSQRLVVPLAGDLKVVEIG